MRFWRLKFTAVSVLSPVNTGHNFTGSLRFSGNSTPLVDQLILPKPLDEWKKLRAEMVVNEDTGLPITETTPGLCLKNADQYTYNQTELHKPNIVDGVSVSRASLLCMVGNAYVAPLFALLPADHSASCDELELCAWR